MPSIGPHTGLIDELARQRFEAAWRARAPVSIESCLPPPDRPEYVPTLTELVLIEMELAWRAAGAAAPPTADTADGGDRATLARPRVEDYLRRFSILSRPDLLQELVDHEFALRCAAEPGADPREYVERFPQCRPPGRPFDATVASPPHAGAAGDAAALPAIPGYTIEGRLAQGGMGVVYRARQDRLNRPVALKMILSGEHAGAEERRRFFQEAEAIGRLQHPNIVTIHEVGECQGRPFLALEFVEGGSLAERIRVQRPTPRQAAELVEALARAMQAVHGRGIVHRDLKPANVLLTPDGTPKVTDFGLAKTLEGAAGQTHTGAVLGTPSYMAPEQAAGRTRDVGPHTDVYALGAILYELLTGQPPFRAGSVAATVHAVLHEEPAAPRRRAPKIHRDLETICLKALAKEPARRYASAEALADDLARYNAGEPIRARRVGLASRLVRRARRNPLLTAALAALVLGALVATYLVMTAREDVRLRDLQARFEQGLNAAEWSPAHADALRGVLAEMEGLAPDRAREGRQRLNEQFRKHLYGLLDRPRLDEDTTRRFEDGARWLAGAHPEWVAELEQALAQRRQVWDPLFTLAAPFDGAAVTAVLPAAAWQTRNGRLVAAPSAGPTTVLATAVPSPGQVRLEAQFQAWEKAKEVGLYLNLGRAMAAPVVALAFTPDGGRLVTLGADGCVHLLEPRTGKAVASFTDPSGRGGLLALSPDGATLATACGDGVRLWALPGGTLRQHWPAADLPDVTALAFSDAGSLLIVGLKDGRTVLRDPAGVKPEVVCRDGNRDIVCARLAEKEGNLITVDRQGDVRVGPPGVGKVRPVRVRLELSEKYFRTVAADPAARLVAACNWWEVRCWERRTGRRGEIRPDWGVVHAAAVAPDGRQLCLGCSEGVVQLWDPLTGRKAQQWVSSPGHAHAVAWTADGSAVAAADSERALKLWHAQNGTELGSLSGEHYAFLLLPGKAGGAARARLVRNGTVLREAEVAVPSGPLELRARRAADRLDLEVNGRPALAFHDPFPLSADTPGFFGVALPAGAELTRLRAWRQAVPWARSPLEQGAEDYARGRFGAALEFFQQQAARDVASDAAQEARCKAALCLVALDRRAEAADAFARLANEPGERWPLIAAVQLWQLRLRDGNWDEAYALFEAIRARFPREAFEAYTPLDLRRRLSGSFPARAAYFFAGPAEAQRTRQQLTMAEFLGAGPMEVASLKDTLLRLLWMTDQTDAARALAEGWLVDQETNPHQADAFNIYLPITYGWLQRQTGHARQWLPRLQALDRTVPQRFPGHAAENVATLRAYYWMELAWTHLALGETAAAEGYLDRILQMPVPPRPYYTHATACLLRGSLHEQRGEAEAARQAWRRGRFDAWRGETGPVEGPPPPQQGTASVMHLIMAALTDSLTDADAAGALEQLVGGAGTSTPIAQAAAVVKVPPAALRTAWLTPRGRAFVHRLARRDLSYAESVHVPPLLVAMETVRHGCLDRPLTPDEDEVLWQLVGDLFTAYRAGKVNAAQLFQMAQTWRGSTNFLGWAGLAPSLEPRLRGPLAYFAGHRYRRLGKAAEVERFFRAALTDAADRPALRRIAQAELDRAAKKP